MNRQTLVIVAVAIVLFAVAVFGALALTGDDTGSGNTHTMPGGSTMTGATTDDGMDMVP